MAAATETTATHAPVGTEMTHEHESSSSLDREATTSEKEVTGNGVEPIRTISRVPGNPNYYEKDGLRTYGDGQEHDAPMPVCQFAGDGEPGD